MSFRPFVVAWKELLQLRRDRMTLAMMVARMTGRRPHEISPEAVIRDLGIDSLMLISLRNQVEAMFQIRVPIVLLFQSLSMRDLSTALRKLMTERKADSTSVRAKLSDVSRFYTETQVNAATHS